MPTSARTAPLLAAMVVLVLAGCNHQPAVREATAEPVPSPPALPPASAPLRMPTPAELDPAPSPTDAQAWAEIGQLRMARKDEAAIVRVRAVREAAQAAGNEEEWTRALITEAQLRTESQGVETAARLLAESPWPEGTLWRIALKLCYARALTNFAQQDWRLLDRREEVVSPEPGNLSTWTRRQVLDEAVRAYADVWRIRDALGSVSVQRLKEFLSPNEYPQEIRGTMRDAASYLLVSQLAETDGWRPEQLAEVWALDLPGLIAGAPEASAGLDVTDPNVHPLLRIGTVLDDLERWHVSTNQPEARLEARLERLRQLHAAFTAAEDRKAIRDALERSLPEYRQLEWWSVGMATLASFLRTGDAPDALIEARRIATEGAKAFPKSIGGRQCEGLVAEIECPQFHLSSMFSDGPRKRSLEVRHANLPALWLRAYRIDLEQYLAKAADHRLLPGRAEIELALKNQKPAYAWKAPLPQTADFRSHRTFVTTPIDQVGTWLVVASAREDFATTQSNQIVGAPLIVTHLALLERQEPGRLEVRVLQSESGEPAAGVEVLFYDANWRDGHAPSRRAVSDTEGVAVFEGATRDPWHFVVAKKGADLTIDPENVSIADGRTRGHGRGALVFTDRSIYRPTQMIRWKVVLFSEADGQAPYQTLPNRSVTVSLRDSNRRTVATAEVMTNGFGSAAGEFAIPTGRALGKWEVTAGHDSATVHVEEYKRPTFEVTLQPPEQELRLNREATFAGEARYFFGEPVTRGQVRWRAARTASLPSRSWRAAPEAGQQVAGGTAPIGADGKFTVRFTPKADERRAGDGVSYSYALSADVIDEGGETRSAARTFKLGFVSVEARIQAGQAFFTAGSPAELKVERTDLDGTPRPGSGSWKLFALEQPAKAAMPGEIPMPTRSDDKYATPGDALRSRTGFDGFSKAILRHEEERAYGPAAAMHEWKQAAQQQAGGTLEHDATGLASLRLPDLAPGAYRLHYETVDGRGANFETSREILVTEPRMKLALPAVLLAQRDSVEAGETLRLLAHGGIPGQPMLLELFRGATRISQQQLRAGSDPSIVELPVTLAHRGGFTARLTMVRDWQLVMLEQPVSVPWSDRELQVELATFRDRLKPGDQEHWSIKVKGPPGSGPDSAELLAYAYDSSLDSFVPHAPVPGLYSKSSGAGTFTARKTTTSLRSQPFEWVGGTGLQSRHYAMLRGDSPRLDVPSRVGEMSAFSVAPATGSAHSASAGAAASPPVRTRFSETAFWIPQLALPLDGEGTAAVEFEVPDSLTSWKVWVHALTTDLKAGSVSREASSFKELMVRPYLPRFVREGDETSIKAVVHNLSDHAIDGTVDLDLLDPEKHQSVRERFGLKRASAAFSAPAGGTADVAFRLRVPSGVGQVAFEVVARSGAVSDGELRAIPVLPSRVRLAQSRFVALKDQASRELRFDDLAGSDDDGLVSESLVVTVDAQLFYSLLSALPHLQNEACGGPEEMLERFATAAMLSKTYASLPAVVKAAGRLEGRKTVWEPFDSADPNRKLAFEETPWLSDARGGEDGGLDLLVPEVVESVRRSTLSKLEAFQTSSGGFPWVPGGPPSPHTTLRILHGFAKAAEFGVQIPSGLAYRAWGYLAWHYRNEYASRLGAIGCDLAFLVYLNYTASSFPGRDLPGGALTAEERNAILDYTFAHRQGLSPYLEAQLALTLKRAGRLEDAKLVLDGVMDAAKTTEDEGTFWMPEPQAWLWHNDTIESHAFIVRALTELDPNDPRRAGLVHWLMLNKKLNQWKSPRATAEVIYALAHYLRSVDQLDSPERATVSLGQRTEYFEFDPAKYAGKKKQVVVPGPQVDPKAMSTIVVAKQTPGLMFASATWNFSTEKPPAEERGDLLHVSRSYFKRFNDGRGFVLQPLSDGDDLSPGDEIEIHLALAARHPCEYIHLRDPRAAGLEPLSSTSRFKWDLGLGYYEEVRDSSTNFFFEQLPQGEYTFKYRLRAATAGTFKTGPATVQSMYAPEFVGYSAGATLKVLPNEE